jgi:hypothetical protein
MQEASDKMTISGGNTGDNSSSGGAVIYLAHSDIMSGNIIETNDHHDHLISRLRSKQQIGPRNMNNIIELSAYRNDGRLAEQERRVFAGMADELKASPLVGDVIIAETDEGEGWLAVMNHNDEMMAHIEKIRPAKWLVAFYWDEYPIIDKDAWADAPIPCMQELDGPVESLRETKFYADLLERVAGGLSYA